jgi:flavin-dependent thymidylate synthase
MSKDVQKWADVAMYSAAPIDSKSGPRVQLLSCNADPLGTIAAAAKMYKGEYVETLALISDQERRHYLEDVRKNALAAPLEFVNFHFLISGVTRGFTHQMVRQRTATYTQESTRFAVKEDVPVGLPPSLAGTIPWAEFRQKCEDDLFAGVEDRSSPERQEMIDDYTWNQASQEQKWRFTWDDSVQCISNSYNSLVNSGMPAEDARGLLPTNLLTRINYNTSLRGLLEHAGLRLCTQSQAEWKTVWGRIMEAIRDYGATQFYHRPGSVAIGSYWQFEELSKIFKPICYKTGKCEFMSDVDRYCQIRDRVQAHAKRGDPSTEWSDINLQSEVYDNYAAARVSQ